jgi:hypothetical protein
VKRPKPQPPIKWRELEPGLEEAKTSKKPGVVVFCPYGYKGDATFEGNSLRKVMHASKAIPIKVQTPKVPRVLPGASAEEIKQIRDAYTEALKAFQEVCKEYGVSSMPTMVFVTDEGDRFSMLFNPKANQIMRAIPCLDEGMKQFKEAKAKAEAEKVAQEEKK